jgi:hypothetical protein
MTPFKQKPKPTKETVYRVLKSTFVRRRSKARSAPAPSLFHVKDDQGEQWRKELRTVEEDLEARRLNTVVLDNDARASDDLSGVTLSVDLGESSPGTEDLGVGDLDEVDLVLGAEGLDELDVLGLGAGLDENAEVGDTLVEGLGALSETSGKSIVDEGVLQGRGVKGGDGQ